MFSTHVILLNFAVALGIGLIIGTDRERSKRANHTMATAGVRTFAIAALLGATSFMMDIWLHIATLLSVVIFVSVAYFTDHHKDPSLTTEISLLLTVVLGGLSMTNSALAASIAIATALLLLIKEGLHGFVLKTITPSELYAFLMLAAATLIILPIVPNALIDPFDAINPRNLWLIVIFMMLINILGHLALRLFGQQIGLPIVGFISGFISSLAAVASMRTHAKQHPGSVYSAACGASFASVATIVQLAILLAAVNIGTLNALKTPFIAAIITMTIYAAVLTLKSLHQPITIDSTQASEFSIRTAFWFAGMIAVVLLVSTALQRWFGQNGLIIGVGLASVADSHSPTVSVATMVASGKIPIQHAVIPILVAVSVNTCSKAVIAMMSGDKTFAVYVNLGLILQVSAMWASWWFF